LSTIPNDVAQETASEELDVAALDDAALDTALKGPPEEAPAEEAEATEEKPKFVPHAALHEERLKRQALERETTELRNWQRQMLERFNAAEEAKRQAELPQPPSMDDDPVGYLAHETKTTRELLERERVERQQRDEQAQWQAYVQHDRQAFVAQTPDFDTAIQFLAESRQRQYEALGYSPHEVQQALNNDALGIATTARERRQSPSVILYNLARAAGYTPPEDTASKLATIAKGQETTRTAGAGKAKAQLTPADLLNMSPEDFDKHWDKVMR